ncbi:MAG TPA: ABC transporter ATP-binding protein [Symbiobacteriaceae bacterium]|nr:ABC transporter ATP-binding protein [Symbiobacteriaceae bacterium]
MLQVDRLNVFYGQIHALKDVTLQVNPGEIIAIVGANGAGKSTLMWTLAGVLKPRSGTITYDGQPLPPVANEVVARGVSLIPERRRLYANLTVRENLLMGAFLRKDHKAIAQDIDKMAELFPIIKERLAQYAGTLSGGEQQMVAIARGLMSRPRILLLDEPTLGLAPLVAENVFQTVLGIRSMGTTVLLAEQNAFRSLEIADRAYVLETGRVTMTGLGADLLNDPGVRRAYLGIKQGHV